MAVHRYEAWYEILDYFYTHIYLTTLFVFVYLDSRMGDMLVAIIFLSKHLRVLQWYVAFMTLIYIYTFHDTETNNQKPKVLFTV